MAITVQHFGEQDILTYNDILIAAFGNPQSQVKELIRLISLQPDGWFMALDEGLPVGTVGVVNYSAFAWIGMMSVHPENQGHGIGSQLMHHILDWLEVRGCRIALLDATPIGEPLYRHFSFQEVDRAVQYIRNDHKKNPGSLYKSGEAFSSIQLPEGIRMMTEADIPLIADFDRLYFGADRSTVFKIYFRDHPERGFIAFAPSGKICGYLLVQSQKLGPWVAETVDTAEILLDVALNLDFPEGLPTVILPAVNWQAKSILERRGFHINRSLSHMQRGGNSSPSRREFIYGQTSFAIG